MGQNKEIDELIENFSFFESWEDKYQYLIDMVQPCAVGAATPAQGVVGWRRGPHLAGTHKKTIIQINKTKFSETKMKKNDLTPKVDDLINNNQSSTKTKTPKKDTFLAIVILLNYFNLFL